MHSLVASHYGIAMTETTELDVGVFRLRRPDGPSWVARVFAAAQSIGATSGDAAVLRFLAAHEFPPSAWRRRIRSRSCATTRPP